jgi:hypothetical protein
MKWRQSNWLVQRRLVGQRWSWRSAVLAKEKVAPVGPYTSISVAPMLTADRRGAVVRLVF